MKKLDLNALLQEMEVLTRGDEQLICGGNGGGYGEPPGGYGGYGPSTDVNNYINTNYSSFFTNNSNVIVTVSDSVPPGSAYTYDPIGKTYLNSKNEPIYGLTYKSGDLIFIYVSPIIGNSVSNGNGDGGIVEHEMLHAQHIGEHSDMYNNNYAKFQLESEYAATYHQWYEEVGVNGNSAAANSLKSQMSSMMLNGAEGIFSTTLK